MHRTRRIYRQTLDLISKPSANRPFSADLSAPEYHPISHRVDPATIIVAVIWGVACGVCLGLGLATSVLGVYR